MDELDTNMVSDDDISEDENMLMREVIKEDADLYFLNHYLSDIFRTGDI